RRPAVRAANCQRARQGALAAVVVLAVGWSAIAAGPAIGESAPDEAEFEFRVELPEPPALEATEEELARGAALYAAQCASCHGHGAVSDSEISDLRYTSTAVHRSWNAIVVEGIYATGGMPAFKASLSTEDAEMIRAFVVERARIAYETCNAIDRDAEPVHHQRLCTRVLPGD
ncbi:MAG: cytochrome c, partial [Gammaproteobacteria bacterium]|nr:cytochrome c [Gammaproteobacteria bacterium]